ncbi:MAG: hypothetical protein AB1779_09910 [Candidatus Thermoplasmatota archaeon]
MRVLSPDEVREKYGQMFCKGYMTIADEKSKTVRIIDACSVKGMVEWNAINRKKAGGAIKDVYVDGNTLIMDAKLGKGEINFDIVKNLKDAQVLESIKIAGEEVHTTWLGAPEHEIAACLPQAPGVIRTFYTNVKLGGEKVTKVTIITPKMRRIAFGFDDTDIKGKGATWLLGLKLAQKMPFGQLISYKVVQLNPNIKEKTKNCVSVAIDFAISGEKIEKAIDYVYTFIKNATFSEHTAFCVYDGLFIPEPIKKFGVDAKNKRITLDNAKRIAKKYGVKSFEVTGGRGIIGSLAAIGCLDMGLDAAGLIDEV